MNCVMVKTLENEFFDDFLSLEQRTAVEQHLQNCESCRSELDILILLRKTLRECDQGAPQALETLVMGAVNRRLQRRPFWEEFRRSLRLWRENWDRRLIFSNLAAMPVTLFFFVLLLSEFSYAPQTTWYPVYTLDENFVLNTDQVDALRLSYKPMVEFAESSSSVVPDDSFVVVTRVNENGSTRLARVIAAPNHGLLLLLFANRIEGGRHYPLLKSGHRTDSYIIVPYQKISVFG